MGGAAEPREPRRTRKIYNLVFEVQKPWKCLERQQNKMNGGFLSPQA
jgi:hypothetical protein